MKAYTDISQSKKLAEILPLESADMGYIPSEEDDDGNTLYTAEFKSEFIFDEDCCIPCWSIAALLHIIENAIKKDDAFVLCIKESQWLCTYASDLAYITSADNPIDACVEMILKLKEKDLL